MVAVCEIHVKTGNGDSKGLNKKRGFLLLFIRC